jgi:prepilin-type N-terminal cleavage/methylation domain-containing protein
MSTEHSIGTRLKRRTPCRARDRGATIPGGRSLKAVRGFTLLELLVAIALLTVMAGTALPSLPRKPYAVWTAQTQVLAELRRARNDALTKGDHFRVDITGASSFVTYRMTLVAGAWVPNGAPVRTGSLPDGILFLTGVGKQFEFTTRGLMVTPDAATTLFMEDPDTAISRGVTVWPSGQVSAA